jgi:serine/threonine protein kinase
MDSTTWKRAKQIFHEALEKSGPDRSGFVDSACGDDERLRARVQALLKAHDEAGEFLASPTVAGADKAARAAATLSSSRPSEGPGTTIGPYKLLQVIGEGGFGVVYMAEQEEPVRRRVALKIIKLGMDTRQVIARFEAERQALALMEHPSIARVLDAGATETGRPYFVMELVKGVPITEYCDSDRLSTNERIALFREVCAAVQHAHQKGIIHRDIKPSNVLVTLHDGKPVPKVIDFGISKATNQRLTEKTLFTDYGQFIGTPAYMSPEQAEMSGFDVDTRSDIYSLGVLLYELLTGTTPFDAETLRQAGYGEIQRIIREVEPPKPSTRLSTLGGALTDIARRRDSDPRGLSRLLRGELDWIVMRALEKERGRRYDSPGEFAADIARHLQHEPVTAGPRGAVYRARKFLRRHRVGVTVVGVAALALVAGLAVATYGLIEARRANVRAEREAATATEVSEFLVGLFEVSDPGEARGNTITAREVLDTGVARIDGELSGEPRVRSRMLATMGRVYSSLGLLEDAEPLLEEAYHLERGLSSTVETRTAQHLAWLYLQRGGYDEAERVYRANLAELKASLGEGHVESAWAMQGLGNLLRIRGQTDEAETLLVRALEIHDRELGRDHPQSLRILGNLAVVYSKLGRHEEAIALLKDCLEGMRKSRGANHFDTLTAQRLLARELESLGQPEEAERLLLNTIATARRVLGKDHPRLQEALRNLAQLYLRRERYAEATPLLHEMMEGSHRIRGEEHPHTLQAMGDLSHAYESLGRYEEATSICVELLEIQRRVMGLEHSQTLATMKRLGVLYERSGQMEKARAVSKELLALRDRAATRRDAGEAAERR